MRRLIQLFVLSLFVLLGAAACTGTGKNAPTPRATTTLRVSNNAWSNVNVYVLYEGTRARLGTVTATSQATFRIPDQAVGTGRNLSFLVDPIGSTRTGTSYDIFVRPGEQVTLNIPATF